jgi:CHAD domain-containing protein
MLAINGYSVNNMASKLKQRRMRRYKSDIAWWMAEAQDWKDIALEHATEIDRLKKLVIRVPMPVVVPESVADKLKLREVG